MRKFDLENRFIDYVIEISSIVDGVDNSKLGNHISGQLIRSGSSPALNYGEAQSAESRKDFIHKMKISLKELRESFICLKIISRAKLHKSDDLINEALTENDELISIFVKSVETARKNLKNE